MKKLVILVALVLMASVLVYSGGQMAKASHPTGPLAYWPFDDGSDPTADVAHGNDGDLKPTSSEPTFDSSDKAPVPSNAKSLAFDGINDFIEVPDDALLRSMTDITISAWIKVETAGCPDSAGLPGEICTIVRRDPGTGATTRTLYDMDLLDGKLRLTFIGSTSGTVTVATAATGPDLRDGEWHHIVIVRDTAAGKARGYIDASKVLDVSDGSTGDFVSSPSTPVLIGQWDVDGKNRRFEGRIDEVKVYDRPLSGDEIISTYLTGDTGTLFVDRDGEVGLGSSVDCDGTGVSVYDIIQDAVDAASSGDTVLLCDDAPFGQSVVFESGDSGITLSAAPGASPVLDGTSLVGSATSVFAITLLNGVSGVTIEGLTIRDYEGDGSGNDRSSAIMAWDVETSDITVRDNVLQSNFWNGVLVGSEGGFVHDNWVVTDNAVEDNGFVGIELTNAGNSEIVDNDVENNDFAGIVVQARNTRSGTGLFTHPGSVLIKGNTVSWSTSGIYLIALASEPVPPFDPITAAQSLLSDVLVVRNDIRDTTDGIRLVGFGGGTISEVNVHHNTVDATTIGIRVTTFASILAGGSAEENNIHQNDVTSAGDFAVTLETGTSDNRVHHNILLATAPDTDLMGDDAVDDVGIDNQVFKNK